MKCIAVLLFVLGLGLGCVAGANAQPTPPDTVPTMTIKVFNDDPTHYAFPVFTAAPHDKFDDVWLQAIFKITKQQVDSQKFGYHTKLSYRFYINPTNGIAPGGNVVLTIPLYTQLVNNPDPAAFDQYIDWWNGVRLEVFYATSSAQPRAFTDDLTNRSQCNPNPCQQSLDLSQNKLPAGALIPICKTDTGGDCETLQFFSDVTNLPKSDPSQLLEMTLGARIDLQPVKTPATDPPNALDLRNVDFDVSYVNDAYGPAAMGPFENDQVGYVGTPQSVTTFESAINQFLTDFAGWPQYIRLFDTDPKKVPVLKLPSPLEILARIIPNSLAPPDLTPLDPSKGQHWPDKLWDPVQALRDNWVDYAGKATDPALGPKCKGKNRIGEKSFCNYILAVKTLMRDNYQHYVNIGCGNPTIPLTDELLISHVYGWTPFVENGCGPAQNLLEKTPGYDKDNFAKYVDVKLQFDSMNYAKDYPLPPTDQFPSYHFNPWVVFIHNAKYANTANAYAYSVDDAVGNIQAEGLGIRIDISSTKNLENENLAIPPVNVGLGWDDNAAIHFKNYRLCKDEASREKPVLGHFHSFIISANSPQTCPVYLRDDRTTPQVYTFKLTKPPPFPLLNRGEWNQTTAGVIDCSGNTTQTGKIWCCEKLLGVNGNGVYAYSKNDPTSIHQLLVHHVITTQAEQQLNRRGNTCNMGK